jgi:ADP-dependent NAD(P)H-hydrate dehydratase
MSRRVSANVKPRAINAALLRRWPLPKPDSEADKEARGTVLVAGGSSQVPGGVVLAGIAALRAGAGKLQLAAPATVAPMIGLSVIEARVFPLSETDKGSLGKGAGKQVADIADSASAILIGPGMTDEKLAASFARDFLRARTDRPLVIDAACIGGLSASQRLEVNAVLTPHAGEMAALLDVPKETVEQSPVECAVEAARAIDAVIVMKGATTFVVTADEVFSYDDGDVGLATSGSGDVLSGIITGLIARGTDLDQAAAWGVAIHGAAGNALAAKVGRIGFLARELLDEIPRAMLEGVLG